MEFSNKQSSNSFRVTTLRTITPELEEGLRNDLNETENTSQSDIKLLSHTKNKTNFEFKELDNINTDSNLKIIGYNDLV